MLAMDVNDNAGFLDRRVALKSIASNRASTGCSYRGGVFFQESLERLHRQWLARAEQEADLQPCVAVWKTTMVKAEGRADRVLDKLSAACFKS